MNDYSAAAIQPIVQGLITVRTQAIFSTPHFQGVGVLSVVRTPATATPPGQGLGDFLLTLDPGLPGDVSSETYKGRVMLTCRGGATGATTITQLAVLYPVLADPQTGTQVRVVTSIGGFGVDPALPDASGLEIIIWRGVQASIPGFTRPPVFKV